LTKLTVGILRKVDVKISQCFLRRRPREANIFVYFSWPPLSCDPLRYQRNYPASGVIAVIFRRFRKIAQRNMSVCPSVHVEQLGSDFRDFHEIL
jgi:hypothetical protein